MTTKEEAELKIYEVTHRETGEKAFKAAKSAQEACFKAGWLIGDCFVAEDKPRKKITPGRGTRMLVKMPCLTCPFQWAECLKPAEEDCPTRPTAPELQDWVRQAVEAHLCGYTGVSLDKRDYFLGQKWIELADAITELTSKP